MLLVALLALTTFACAAAGDYVETRYVQAATAGPMQAHRAARASVLMYLIGTVGWLIVVKVDLLYCLPEVGGLYLGTWLAARRRA